MRALLAALMLALTVTMIGCAPKEEAPADGGETPAAEAPAEGGN